MRTEVGAAHSRLRPPAVVGAGIVFRPVRVTLAPSTDIPLRRRPTSGLFPPAVVGAGIVFRRVKVTLAPSTDIPLRRRPRSRLRPPAVVGAGIVFRPVKVRLAPSSRGKPTSRLFAPVIPPLARPLHVTLARIVPPPTTSRLSPPTVVFVATELMIRTTLAQIRPVPTRHTIAPPTVVFVATELTLSVTLTRITPPPTLPTLRPPAVVGAGIVFAPIAAGLAPSTDIPRRRRPYSRLLPPAVVQPFGTTFDGPVVHLAPSSRGVPKSALRAPAVIGAGIVFRPVKVWLTRLDLTRRQPHPTLHAPARGAGIVFGPLDVTLAPSTDIPLRRRTVAALKSPVVVNHAPAFLPPEIVALAPQSRGAPHSRLSPPAVVGGGVYFYPVRVKLAASSRGVPKSVLRPMLFAAPARPIEEEIAVQIVRTSLIERAPHSRLSPPTIVRQPPFRPLLVKLAPSTRGIPKSTLRPPLPPPPLARAIAVRLAPQTRGKPMSRLAPPTAVRTAVLYPVRVRLAQIRPVPTRHLLAPPSVVFVATELTIRVALAPSSRGKPVYLLRPPTVVNLATELTLRVKLAPSSRGVPRSKLAPPSIVEQQPFAPIEVTLVRIRPPHTTVRLSPPAVVTPYQPPLVTALSIHLAVAERVALGPRLATHTRLRFPPIIIIPIPGFTTGRIVPGGAAESHDVPDAGGSAESKPRDRGEVRSQRRFYH